MVRLPHLEGLYDLDRFRQMLGTDIGAPAMSAIILDTLKIRSTRAQTQNLRRVSCCTFRALITRSRISTLFSESRSALSSLNGLIERFNRTYREEVLDAYLIESLEQLRRLTYEFIWSYNNERPHDALRDLTPREFLLKCGQLPALYTGSRADFPTFQYDDHNIDHGMMIFWNSYT